MKRIATTAACAGLLAAALSAPAGAHTASTARATAAQSVSGLDKEYLTTSMEGDLFEVAGGRLALTRSHNPSVLNLARTLIKDHTNSYRDAARLARRLGETAERTPSPSEQWELQVVARLRGNAFDHCWTSLENYDHRQDIQEASDEISDGENADVIADARMDLPMLQKHLRMPRSAYRTTR